MTEQEIIKILEDSGALLTGHFQLRSGLHSNRFFQAALLLQYPDKAEKVCRFLADQFRGEKIDAVISPAVGGLIVGQEVARALGCRAILVAEDVVTKGGRVQQTIDLARSFGADIVGIAVIVDRSGGDAKFDVPFKSALKLSLPTFQPEECPLCKEGLPVDRPGSK